MIGDSTALRVSTGGSGVLAAVWAKTGTTLAKTNPNAIKTFSQRTSVSPCTEENDERDDLLRYRVV